MPKEVLLDASPLITFPLLLAQVPGDAMHFAPRTHSLSRVKAKENIGEVQRRESRLVQLETLCSRVVKEGSGFYAADEDASACLSASLLLLVCRSVR